jgi:hypothetical protein
VSLCETVSHLKQLLPNFISCFVNFASNMIFIKLKILIFCLHCAIAKNCSFNQLDNNLAAIIGMYGLKEVKFPQNNAELNRYCK